MMKIFGKIHSVVVGLLMAGVTVSTDAQSSEAYGKVKNILTNLVEDNNKFSAANDKESFENLNKGQNPQATVVMCSDSRVHTHAFDSTPVNDLFVIRNIGNQLETAEGSIEYGVHHLHTPLLIFMGHTGCGAVKTAAGDYSSVSAAIKKELDTIKVPKETKVAEGVVMNVHHQVADSLLKFSDLIKDEKLVIVGAVYDTANELGHGFGKLVFVNVNGEKDSNKIQELPYVKGIKGMNFGNQKQAISKN